MIKYNNIKHNIDNEQTQQTEQTNDHTNPLVQIDNNWRELEQLCINHPATFIDQLPNFNVQVLNYIKKSGTKRMTLFGVGLCTKNYDLVKSMLESDMFTVSTLNQPVYGINPFAYVCSTDVEIAFLMLNSEKILSSTINAVHGLFFHPIKEILCVKSSKVQYSDTLKISDISN